GDTTINGGILVMNTSPVAINTVHLLSGTLSGSADISPNGLFTWTNGTLTGTAAPTHAAFNPNGGIFFKPAKHPLNKPTLTFPAGALVPLSGQSHPIRLLT